MLFFIAGIIVLTLLWVGFQNREAPDKGESSGQKETERIAYVQKLFENADVYARYPNKPFLNMSSGIVYFVQTPGDERYHVEVWDKGDSFNHNLTPIVRPFSEEVKELNDLMVHVIKEHDKKLTESME